MPRVLSQSDVADFRERLCEAAERLFTEHGPEAVTMRQLAAELGVSPMTPYRYFRDKGEILSAVRAKGFNRFAEALEADRARAARDAGASVGEAYLAFALEHSHAYKLMFDPDQPLADDDPALMAAGRRARCAMNGYVEDAVAAGRMSGDPQEIGLMFWAAVHGAVVLELAGLLKPGGARDLHQALDATLSRGLRPGA